MDALTLREAILYGPAAAQCAPWVLLPGPCQEGVTPRDYDQRVADALNALPLTERQPRDIGRADVLSGLGLMAGSAVLSALAARAADSDLAGAVLEVLGEGRLPIAHPDTEAALLSIGLDAAQRVALLGLAVQPVVVTAEAVSLALRGG